MASANNYLSKTLAVTNAFVSHNIGQDIKLGEVSAIQNNTTGVMSVKFNGGEGELLMPAGSVFEPFRPIIGDIAVKSTAAGNACVMG